MRKKLIVGNWKMRLNITQSHVLVGRLHERIKAHKATEVVLAPSLLAMHPISSQIDKKKFKLAAQNAFYKDEGAYTGEVSFTMLRGLVRYVIVGHSERRQYFGESLDAIRDKMAAAVRNGIVPILCIGETKEERQAKETRQVLHDQLVTALSNLTAEEIQKIVIAYEPVWAISTFDGTLAKPDQAEKEIQFIRRQIADLYGASAAESVRILYGGSVDDSIASGYLAIDGCDGVLVGGSSVNPHQFSGIVAAAQRLSEGGK